MSWTKLRGSQHITTGATVNVKLLISSLRVSRESRTRYGCFMWLPFFLLRANNHAAWVEQNIIHHSTSLSGPRLNGATSPRLLTLGNITGWTSVDFTRAKLHQLMTTTGWRSREVGRQRPKAFHSDVSAIASRSTPADVLVVLTKAQLPALLEPSDIFSSTLKLLLFAPAFALLKCTSPWRRIKKLSRLADFE